jgi:thiol-disulfide isomerase/thioredoxin
LAVVLAAACAAGCGKDCAPTSAGGTELPATPDVTVKEVKYPELAAAVEKPKGKVVLVDFWGTFCGPCVKKFPHFVALHEKYADKGLVCVSVTLDDAEDIGKVREFLFEKKAKFPNFLIRPTTAEEPLMKKKFNFDYTLPQMALFSRKGDRVWDTNTEPIDEKDLTAFAEKMDKLVTAELGKQP